MASRWCAALILSRKSRFFGALLQLSLVSKHHHDFSFFGYFHYLVVRLRKRGEGLKLSS